VVWFAHAVPSTFTDMQKGLKKLKEDEQYKEFLKMDILCLTLARTPIPLITITDNVRTHLEYEEELRLVHQIPNIVKKAYR
jgi:hypothetical protein